MVVISGLGAIMGKGVATVEFKGGDTVLVPAAYEGVVRFGDKTQYLTVTI